MSLYSRGEPVSNNQFRENTAKRAVMAGVACARMGLQFVGIERERKYFDIACRRIEQAYAQPRLFEDAKVGAGDTAVQGDMLLPANA